MLPAAIAGVGCIAAAASQAYQPVLPGRLDQGFADVDGLRISLRVVPDSFRADTGFEHVYRAPDGRLYRVAGAIYAVFDRSVYVPTRGGVLPTIPPGTTFHIGTPTWDEPNGAGRSETGRITRALSRRVAAAPAARSAMTPAVADPVPRIGDETAQLGAANPTQISGVQAIRQKAWSFARAAPRRPTVAQESVRRQRLEAIAIRFR